MAKTSVSTGHTVSPRNRQIVFGVKSGKEVKVVLVPEVLIKDNHKFKIKELKRIIEIIEQHYEFIIKKWHETHH